MTEHQNISLCHKERTPGQNRNGYGSCALLDRNCGCGGLGVRVALAAARPMRNNVGIETNL